MGQTGSPETSVSKHLMPCNISEAGRIKHLQIFKATRDSQLVLRVHFSQIFFAKPTSLPSLDCVNIDRLKPEFLLINIKYFHVGEGRNKM